MLNFLATLVLAVTPTIEVTDAPVQPGLPAYVKTMPAEEYEAWAIWQNNLARKRAEKENLYGFEQSHYTVNRTTLNSRSGGHTRSSAHGNTSRESTRGQSRSTRRNIAERNRTNWQTITSATVPTRYRNPYYVPTPVHLYSPYVKSTSDRKPDWDNLFIPLGDGAITVVEAMELINYPMPPETLFRLIMLRPQVIDVP